VAVTASRYFSELLQGEKPKTERGPIVAAIQIFLRSCFSAAFLQNHKKKPEHVRLFADQT
jgi:hypothetical protein